MQYRNKITFTFLILLASVLSFGQEPTSHLWILNSLSNIDGNNVSILGNPEVVATDLGDAIEFDGVGDRILVDANPIGEAKEFTVEVIFKPYGSALNQNNDPRFIHIQDPNDSKSKRVMMEIRVNASNQMYLDGFMLTDNDNLALIDETKTHATNEWIHAAITFKENTFTTYINGVMELSGTVNYDSKILDRNGKTSIGARMDARNWYNGIVKCLKITHESLAPETFISVDQFKTNSVSELQNNNDILKYNPQTKSILLNKLNENSTAEATAYNMQGRAIKTFYLNQNKSNLSVANWQKGVYIIQIKKDEQFAKQRILIQ